MKETWMKGSMDLVGSLDGRGVRELPVQLKGLASYWCVPVVKFFTS